MTKSLIQKLRDATSGSADEAKRLIAGGIYSGMQMARMSERKGGSLMVGDDLADDATYAKALADRVIARLSALEGES